MGNYASIDEYDTEYRQLALSAVARRIDLRKGQVLFLRDVFAEMASYDEMITHKEFSIGLKKARFTNREDLEVINLLFTMWDSEGDDEISYRQFIMGVAPLACPDEDLYTILKFSLEVNDDDGQAIIGEKELFELLQSIDSTASFFGDPTLKRRGVRKVVDEVFAKGETEIEHRVCLRRLVRNEAIQRFAKGQASTRVKFKEEVEEIETVAQDIEWTDSLSSLLASDSLSSSESAEFSKLDPPSCLSTKTTYSESSTGSLSALLREIPTGLRSN